MNPSPARQHDGAQLALWRGRDRWVRRFDVESTTRPGQRYVVAVDVEGRWGCSCPAWVHDPNRKPCKHIQGVRRREVAGGRTQLPV